MKKKKKGDITHRSESIIRFSEVDSMRIMWHGNYTKLLEDGREAFGLKHGISYLDVYENNYMTPIVKLSIDYKQSLEYGDTAIIETRYINTESAKIHFEYTIYKKSDNSIVATGESIQVFINTDKELILFPPDFYLDWKRKMRIIE